MKKILGSTLVFCCFFLTAISCQHEESVSPVRGIPEVVSRKIIFDLYTSEDFSDDEGVILFQPVIYKSTGAVLWDSTFAPMHIKDIPSLSDKIVFEKGLRSSDTTVLYAGFKYAIEGVGNSWHYEQINKEERIKTISFDFK